MNFMLCHKALARAVVPCKVKKKHVWKEMSTLVVRHRIIPVCDIRPRQREIPRLLHNMPQRFSAHSPVVSYLLPLLAAYVYLQDDGSGYSWRIGHQRSSATHSFLTCQMASDICPTFATELSHLISRQWSCLHFWWRD